MKMIDHLESTAAVIRSYCNPMVATQVENLLNIGLGRVYVVVNAAQDREATKGFLRRFNMDPHVQIIEMTEGYTWSSALNIAIMAIQMFNIRQRREGLLPIRFVFNVSVEALFKAGVIKEMIKTMADDDQVGVVGTTFQGWQSGNQASLGSSYRHPRNTGMLIHLEALGRLFGFDLWCDSIGGMEDIDFMLRMLALTELHVEILPFHVPLLLGQHYDQASKEARERGAMQKIINRWRGLFLLGSAERTRIDDAIRRMQLEL